MINIAAKVILEAKISGMEQYGLAEGRWYPIVATMSTIRPRKDAADASDTKEYDQLVVISDSGKWFSIYPSKAIVRMILPPQPAQKAA